VKDLGFLRQIEECLILSRYLNLQIFDRLVEEQVLGQVAEQGLLSWFLKRDLRRLREELQWEAGYLEKAGELEKGQEKAGKQEKPAARFERANHPEPNSRKTRQLLIHQVMQHSHPFSNHLL
jgi:hypothetical protein